MADIFVSYTSSDRDWALWLAGELKTLGHNPFVHEWEIEKGEDIYAWMETRIDAAHHMLCVVSEEYLKAPYSALERRAELWHAAKAQPGFVLMVVVKPCRLPRLSTPMRRVDLVGRPREQARKLFREFMATRQPAASETAAIAAPVPAQSIPDPFVDVYAATNITVHVPEHFLGRDDALEAIDKALGRYEGRVAITALHGLRGVGKTVLAAAYAERHRADYRAAWWLRADGEAGIRADLVGLGVRLGWVAPDEQEEPALTAVMERLRHEGDGILLIYDNALSADAIRPFLPYGGAARIIVTSNFHAWRGVAEPVEIRLWPKEIGGEFLLLRAGRGEGERMTAESLSEALGGLPLAHEQAAAYCERLGVSLADYIGRFAAAPVRLLDSETDAPLEYHDRLTVAKTFTLAIAEAAKLHPAAKPLLTHAALLAAEPIPLFLFAEGREALGVPLAAALTDDGLDEAVAALRGFALVEREPIPDERDPSIATDTIRLHRLVRQVAAAQCQSEARDAARRALTEAMASVYPRSVFDDPVAWRRARRLDRIALNLIAETELPMLVRDAPVAASRLLDRLASYRQGALGAYAEARPLFERALAICEQALGSDHLGTAACLNNLALLLHEQDGFTAARRLYVRALAINEKALGPDHPSTAMNLNNLAVLLQAQGNFAAALPLHKRALAIREKALGPNHPDTATSLNNLAGLHYEQCDFAAARPLLDRALAIREKVLGPNHPDTATSFNNLAGLLDRFGLPDEAASLRRRHAAGLTRRVGDNRQ